MLLRRLERDGYTPSVYGIWLRTNWRDATFVFGVTGRWGFKLYDELNAPRDRPFVFVDVGANFGAYSLVAARNSNCRAVYSIEPNPHVAEQLNQNKSYNKSEKLHLLECAVSSSVGTMDLYFSSTHTGTANFARTREGSQSVTVEVRDRSLFDQIVNENSGCGFFVKIDVEGAEPDVMQQLEASTMSYLVDRLFVEISPKWVSPDKIAYIFAAAKRMGLQEMWRGKGKEQYDVLFERSEKTK